MVSLSLPLGDEGLKEKNGARSLPISQRVPSAAPDSSAEQEPQHRRQHLFRLPGQLVLAGTGHRMGDQGEGVVGGAMGFRDGPTVRHEEFGADGGDRNAAPLQEDAVEHTAR